MYLLGESVPNPPKMFPSCSFNPNYIEYRNSCWQYNERQLDWFNAENQCQQDGGHLASIIDLQEFAIIDVLTDYKRPLLWIGLVSEWVEENNNTELKFEWTDHWPVYFTRWGYGQPETNDQSKTALYCAFQAKQIHPYQGAQLGWYVLDDVQCANRSLPFICKKHLTSHETENFRSYKCPSSNDTQWINFERTSPVCYFAINYEPAITYDTALHDCEMRGGSLPSIHSVHEMKILQKFKSKYWFHHTLGFWIGLRIDPEGQASWTDGSSLNFENFEGDFDPAASKGKCALLTENGAWRIVGCEERHYHICEIRKVPPPQSNESDEAAKLAANKATGGIVGGVICAIFLVALLGFVAYRIFKKRRMSYSSYRNGIANIDSTIASEDQRNVLPLNGRSINGKVDRPTDGNLNGFDNVAFRDDL